MKTMQITRESIFAKCDELGEEEVKNKIPHWQSLKREFAEDWLKEQSDARQVADRRQRNLNIRSAHRQHGYTLKEIADSLGVHYSTVSKVAKTAG